MQRLGIKAVGTDGVREVLDVFAHQALDMGGDLGGHVAAEDTQDGAAAAADVDDVEDRLHVHAQPGYQADEVDRVVEVGHGHGVVEELGDLAAARGPHVGDGAGERGEDGLALLVRLAVAAGHRGHGAGPGPGAAAADRGVEVADPLPGQVPGNLTVLPRVAGAVVDDDQAGAQGVFHARGPHDLPDVAVVAQAQLQDVDGCRQAGGGVVHGVPGPGEDVQALRAASPHVQPEAAVADGLGHRRSLVAQANEPDPRRVLLCGHDLVLLFDWR